MESIVDKYQSKNIFSSPPKQNKFEEENEEIENNIHFLRENFNLKYKGKKIDWIASLQARARRKTRDKTKAQQEEDFGKMTRYLETEHKLFIATHVNQFSRLNNLKELNRWVHTLAKKEAAARSIAYSRFFLGRRMGKKVLSPALGGIEPVGLTNQKNDKFGLEPVVVLFKS